MREASSQSTRHTWRAYAWALLGLMACAAGTVQLVAGEIAPWLPTGQIAFGVFALVQSARSFLVTRSGA